MSLEEVIEYIKTCNDAEKSEFIEKRIDYLNKNETELSSNGIGYAIKAYANEPVAYRFFLHKDANEIMAVSSFASMYGYYFDITQEVAQMLLSEIKASDVSDIQQLCAAVSKVIFDYFGGRSVQGTLKDRLSHIKDEDVLLDGEKNYISAFKGTGQAWCAERTAVAHQLFKILGIESQIVVSPVVVDGKPEYHAFNMIRGEENTILFDSTMIDYSQPEDNYDSIVEVLPLESFDKLNKISERIFMGKNGEERSCKINPKNVSMRIIDVGYSKSKGF